MQLLTSLGVPDSPARVDAPTRPLLRVGAVQLAWDPDPAAHASHVAEGVALAAEAGASVVCLPELTLSPYLAPVATGPGTVAAEEPWGAPEALPGGPTSALATALAIELGVHVQASLWEADPAVAPRGWNTSICVSPAGELVARTRKLHIPVTAGYHEDRWFAAGDGGYPVVDIPLGADPADTDPAGTGDDPADAGAIARFGFPTCWDQWFPELARAYSLAGAEVLVYPTAIGSEPDHPDFDTQPLWQQVIVANGIGNGTFMVAVNRIGTEQVAPDAPAITFYGSSFISDPYGRVLVQAPRDEAAVLVADLDLDARRDWLTLFPFLTTRRPDTYGSLTTP